MYDFMAKQLNECPSESRGTRYDGLSGQFSFVFLKFVCVFFGPVVAISGLVHDVRAIFHIH